MKIVVTEGQIKAIVREMLGNRSLLNEISAQDAYTKFYSDPQSDKYVDHQLYNALMDGAKLMTPYHKLILDTYLQDGAREKGLLIRGGDVWAKGSVDARQYLVRIASDDAEYLRGRTDRVYRLINNVSGMQSHTENSFHTRGLETLYEDDTLIVTTTKSYTASAKAYGDSHWCTASDMFGRYDGFEMFLRYTEEDEGILVQFISKEDKEKKSFQVQYSTQDWASVAICDWFDKKCNIDDLLRTFGVDRYSKIYREYIKPNISRIYHETEDNLNDEKEYYERQRRIKENNILSKIKKKYAEPNLEASVCEFVKNTRTSESRRNILDLNDGEFVLSSLTRLNQKANSGEYEYYLVNVYYRGTGWLRDFISDACENDDEKWQMATAQCWVVDKNFRVVRKFDGESEDMIKNLIFVSVPGQSIMYNAKTGAMLAEDIYEIQTVSRNGKLYAFLEFNTGEKLRFDAETGEEVTSSGTDEADNMLEYVYRFVDSRLLRGKVNRYQNGSIDLEYYAGAYAHGYPYKSAERNLEIPAILNYLKKQGFKMDTEGTEEAKSHTRSGKSDVVVVMKKGDASICIKDHYMNDEDIYYGNARYVLATMLGTNRNFKIKIIRISVNYPLQIGQ